MTSVSANAEPEAAELDYTLWVVLRRKDDSPTLVMGLEAAVAEVTAGGVTVRGFYDVTGMRADADIMLWLTAPEPELLQWGLRILRRAEPLRSLNRSWSAMGVHRTAEFSRDHAPAFVKGLPPKEWLTVYPFVRSYDWYLLPEDERRQMLRDHGIKGSEFPQVQANTVSSFALGDYEWILALESDELVDLVDLMRHLRNTEARRHVREEVPFYTGRRIELEQLAEVLW